MSTVTEQITIDAPLQRVWETVMDPESLARWVSIHRSVGRRGEDWPQVGSELDQTLHMRGVTFKVRWTLEAVRPPYHALWHGRGPALSKAVISYRLSGDPHGPTTFHYENEFHAPGGPLGSVASRVFVGHAAAHEAKLSLTRLKALLERH